MTETTLLDSAAPAPEEAAAPEQPLEQTDGAQAQETTESKPEVQVGAPEHYEAFSAPEGMSYDDQVITAYQEAARDLNLPQDKAQGLLDKVAPVILARQLERNQAASAEWVKESQADPEFGGVRLHENLAIAKRAYDQFSTPKLREMLNITGLGNHPEMVRLMYRAGKAISEDQFVAGGRATAASDPAKRLFPNQL